MRADTLRAVATRGLRVAGAADGARNALDPGPSCGEEAASDDAGTYDRSERNAWRAGLEPEQQGPAQHQHGHGEQRDRQLTVARSDELWGTGVAFRGTSLRRAGDGS